MPDAPDPAALLRTNLAQAAAVAARCEVLSPALADATRVIGEALLAGRKLLACGNGGSAGDAAHLTSEIANRYSDDRPPYPAIDLTADHNIVTAIANDYGIDQMFARQVWAHGKPGDVLCVFSTSGNSANIVSAIAQAKSQGVHTIAFLGKGGGKCKGLSDIEFIVPSDVTARVQEMHLVLYHTICEALEPALARVNSSQ
ncbi:MAG: SIS domain-containing protein [Phycisphaerales bacterium JB063]